MAQGILRPLSYGDLFDELFDLYKKNFILFVGISAVLLIPIYAIGHGIGTKNAIDTTQVLAILASYVILAVTTFAVAQCYLGNKTTIKDSYKAVGRSIVPFFLTLFGVLFRILGMSLLASIPMMALIFLKVDSIFVFIAAFIPIVPCIMLAFRYAFVSQVFVLEGKRGNDGRSRSATLARHNTGRIFVVLLLTTILVLILQMILMSPILAIVPVNLGRTALIITGLSTGIVTALIGPIQMMALVLLYYDIRVREEGFDIQMLASNMGMALPAAPAAPKPTDLNGSF